MSLVALLLQRSLPSTDAITIITVSHAGLLAAESVADNPMGRQTSFGFRAVENPMPVHDLHATMLHLLGLDHKRLAYRYAGRDFRLTDVHGHVVRELLA